MLLINFQIFPTDTHLEKKWDLDQDGIVVKDVELTSLHRHIKNTSAYGTILTEK